MLWECSECGEAVEAARPPPCCPACGLAVLFSPVDEEDEGATGYVQRHWYDARRHPHPAQLEAQMRLFYDDWLDDRF